MVTEEFIVKKPSDVKFCGTYILYNKVNGKYYVGSSYNIAGRINDHLSRLRNNKHYNQHLQRAWNKYDEKNFVFCHVVKTNNHEEALVLEQYLIDFLDAADRDLGYNIDTAVTGHKISDETKKKLSDAKKGRKWTEEQKLRRKEMLKTRPKRKLSEEQKEKLRQVNTGVKFSDERRRKISERALQNRGISKEKCDKVIELYLNGTPTREIEKIMQMNPKRIYAILKRNNIPKRSKKK